MRLSLLLLRTERLLGGRSIGWRRPEIAARGGRRGSRCGLLFLLLAERTLPFSAAVQS